MLSANYGQYRDIDRNISLCRYRYKNIERGQNSKIPLVCAIKRPQTSGARLCPRLAHRTFQISIPKRHHGPGCIMSATHGRPPLTDSILHKCIHGAGRILVFVQFDEIDTKPYRYNCIDIARQNCIAIIQKMNQKKRGISPPLFQLSG